MNPVRLLVVGAGQRGSGYARHAVESGAGVIVGVAEKDPSRRERFASAYGIQRENVFSDWASIDAKIADAAVIGTQDRDHEGPAVRLAGLGYHLLLEKPMAPTFESAARIARAAVDADVMLAVCHVLRYASYTQKLKSVVDSGRLGRIVSIQHLEPVGWWHQAHSFVRGNWRSAAESSPMLLAKSCHDIDWLLYLAGQPARRVSSFGGLAHFTPESKPAGAGDRCVSCAVESSCPYSAVRIYSRSRPSGWPRDVLGDDLELALAEGPYGECVYNGQNDVVDHQVVNMELADGATVSFTMTAFTPYEQRKTRIFGTHGYLSGNGARLRVVDFRDGSSTVEEVGSVVAGHAGGDEGLVDAFLAAVASGDRTLIRSDAATSLAGHQVVWAAEEARALGTVVTLSQPSFPGEHA